MAEAKETVRVAATREAREMEGAAAARGEPAAAKVGRQRLGGAAGGRGAAASFDRGRPVSPAGGWSALVFGCSALVRTMKNSTTQQGGGDWGWEGSGSACGDIENHNASAATGLIASRQPSPSRQLRPAGFHKPGMSILEYELTTHSFSACSHMKGGRDQAASSAHSLTAVVFFTFDLGKDRHLGRADRALGPAARARRGAAPACPPGLASRFPARPRPPGHRLQRWRAPRGASAPGATFGSLWGPRG